MGYGVCICGCVMRCINKMKVYLKIFGMYHCHSLYLEKPNVKPKTIENSYNLKNTVQKVNLTFKDHSLLSCAR